MDRGGEDHEESKDAKLILDLLTAGTKDVDALVKYERSGTPRAIRMRLGDDYKTLECWYEADAGFQKETIEISNVRAFRYGLNTETVFSHSEVNSEAFKDVNNLSFYLIYDHGRAQETGDRSIEQSLNLTATSSQSYDLWSNLCGLIALWRLCKTPQKDLLTCSRSGCQHFIKVPLLLAELVRRNAVDIVAALEAITFLMDSGLQGYAVPEETALQAALRKLCNSITTILNKNSSVDIAPLLSKAGLAEEIGALLCRLLLRAGSLPALQDAASVALQKLSLQLPTPSRLALHASVLAVLSAAAGHLSTVSMVTLLSLLAENAVSGGYLTQQTAQELRMLALVKDQRLSVAASKTVAALPVTGSVFTAAEEKFAFLERTLLPLPVLKRASEQEPSESTPEIREPVDPASAGVSQSPEKQILLSPYPFVPCRAATRQHFESGDHEEFPGDTPARKTPPRAPQIQAEAPASPVVLHPSPLSPKKSTGAPRSPLSSKSPIFSRSRDLARLAASKSPQNEHRAVSPPGKNGKHTPTGAAKKALFSTDANSKDPATRSPLRENVERQRSNGGDQGLAPSSPGPRSSRTLGQVANQFEARKEVWKKTAAKKKESTNKIPEADAKQGDVLAGVQVFSRRGSFSGAELEVAVQKPTEGSVALLKPAETVREAAVSDNTIGPPEGLLGKQTATLHWDSLTVEEWLHLAKLEECAAAEDST